MTYVHWLSANESELRMLRADGSSIEAEPLVDLGDRTIASGGWLPDGERLWVKTVPNPTQDIFVTEVGGDGPEVSLASDFHDTSPTFSPDGRYVAYVTNESGVTEVYVRPFPNVNDAKWQVSSDGGREPLWSHDGAELFYKNAVRELVAVDVSTEGDFEMGDQRALFTLPIGASVHPAATMYDVTSDDERFLMLRAAGASSTETLGHYVVVENFLEEVEERLGG